MQGASGFVAYLPQASGGKPSALAARNGPYGAGPIASAKPLEAWRAKGDLEGLEVGRG